MSWDTRKLGAQTLAITSTLLCSAMSRETWRLINSVEIAIAALELGVPELIFERGRRRFG